MFNKQQQKRRSFFGDHILLHIAILIYFPFAICGCTGQIARRNATYDSLDNKTKKSYVELISSLEIDEKEAIKKKAGSIQPTDKLRDYIHTTFETCKQYNELVSFLPKNERNVCKKDFITAVYRGKQKEFVNQQLVPFKVLKRTPQETQTYYVDFLEILPENEAITLKKKIIDATTSKEIEQIIASKFPKELNDSIKERLYALSDYKRRETIKHIIDNSHKHYLTNQPNEKNDSLVKDQDKNSPNQSNHRDSNDTSDLNAEKIDNDAHATTSSLDLDEIITAAEYDDDEDDHESENIAKDDWKNFVPLEDDLLEEFIHDVTGFEGPGEQDLKNFMLKINKNCIYDFFYAYEEAFKTKEERRELLQVVLTVIQKDERFALKVCEHPESLNRLNLVKGLFVTHGHTGPLIKLVNFLNKA